jgi:hypothetical protein
MATPKNNTSRGYYSPNAKVKEGYYKVASNNFVIIFKTSIANAIGFASRTRKIGVVKVAKALISSLASATKSLNRVRKSSANVIGYIIPNRIDHFFRYSTARLANLAIARKTYKGTRVAISTAINLAFNSKSARRIKTGKATQSSLGIASKTLRRSKKALATIAAVIKSNKILSLTARVIITSLAKAARRFGKSIKVALAPLALFTRKRTQNKKAVAIQVVSATITRKKGPKRFAGVIVTYQIGTNKRTTMYRKAIANAVGLYKYSLKRISNIYAKESGTVQPVNQINYYVTPNNIDIAGNYAVGTDQTSDYAEPTNDPGVEYSIEKDQTADYSEPDFPNGEDVVPT